MTTAPRLGDQVTAVIVTFNSAHVVGRALASLPEGVRAVVVDNASRDGSAAAARAAGATVLAQAENLGFGRGANAGVAEVATPYAAVVNPDVQLAPGCLEACVAAAEAAPAYWLLGAVEVGVDVPGVDAVTETAEISGAFLVVRRGAVAAPVFDPAFFMYFEDNDLCLRVRAAGGKVGIVAAARFSHARGASTAPDHDSAVEKARLWGASCAYFAQKHANRPEGARAARKLRRYRMKAALHRALLRRDAAAVYAARVAGAAAFARDGVAALVDTPFRRLAAHSMDAP